MTRSSTLKYGQNRVIKAGRVLSEVVQTLPQAPNALPDILLIIERIAQTDIIVHTILAGKQSSLSKTNVESTRPYP